MQNGFIRRPIMCLSMHNVNIHCTYDKTLLVLLLVHLQLRNGPCKRQCTYVQLPCFGGSITGILGRINDPNFEMWKKIIPIDRSQGSTRFCFVAVACLV